MHVGEYNHAVQMYRKCLMVGLLILISGNVINLTFQFYDSHFIFAQTNQAPEAKDQKVSVNANDKVKLTLEGNDDDKDDKIQFDIVSDPSHGKLNNFDKSDGTVTYIPEQDYSGDDGFKFKVIDDKGEQSDKASVEIEVKSTNQAPKAEDQKVSVDANDKVKITLEGNDDDKDDKIQFDIVSDPSHGKLDNFDKSDGTVTYIPEQDYSGDDGFKFKVIDDKGEQSDKASVEIKVKSTNQAPKAEDQKVSIDANDKVNITLEGNDDDKDDKIQFDIVSDPSHGKLDNFDKSDGTVTYIPEQDYSGDDGFKFKVIDDKGTESDKASVEIEVKSTNQAPKAEDQKVSVDADDKVKITLEGKDDDKDDKIQFDIVSDPSHGKLDNFDKSDGTVTYIPEQDYSGDDGFKFKVIDDKGEQSDKASVEIEVKSTNQAPKAEDQKVSVDADDKVKITLEGKDDDKDDKIQFDIVSDPSHGKLDNFDKSDGTVTYIPEQDYSGDDGFKFKVIDDKGEQSDKASVEIKVKSTNQAPKAEDQKVSIDANDKVKITLEGNDDDKDDKIQFDIVSDPSHGKLDNFDKSDGTVTYIPEQDYSGDDGFKFKVIDDKGEQSDSADVEIEVKAVTQTDQQATTTTGDETDQQATTTTGDETDQQATTTTGDETDQQATTTTGDETNTEAENQTTKQLLKNNELSANNQSPFAYGQDLSIHMNEKADITLNGKDDDNYPIQFAIVSNPTDASLDNFDTTKGTLTFVPETDYIGNESFAFKVIDDKEVESNVATVSVEVSPLTNDVNMNNLTNQAPKALDQNEATDKNNQLNITLNGKDDDNDPIQFAIVSNPTDASLDNFDTTKGTLTFVPETDYIGNESFAFKVIDDKEVESNVATVSVEVSPLTNDVNMNNLTNQAPKALDQNEATDKNNQLNITLNGKDEDNDPIQFAIVSNPTDASLDNFDTTKGTLTFVPEADYIGNESFAFKVI